MKSIFHGSTGNHLLEEELDAREEHGFLGKINRLSFSFFKIVQAFLHGASFLRKTDPSALLANGRKLLNTEAKNNTRSCTALSSDYKLFPVNLLGIKKKRNVEKSPLSRSAGLFAVAVCDYAALGMCLVNFRSTMFC